MCLFESGTANGAVIYSIRKNECSINTMSGGLVMREKVVVTVMVLLLSLAGVSTAAIVVTTANGLGADGGVSNDTNQRSTAVINGNTASIRHYDGTRAKAAIVRFDVRNVGGNLSGATLSYTTTSANRARNMGIYYMTDDSLDNWNEATIGYRTAPGLLPSGPLDNGYDGYDNAILTMDTSKWISLGTIPVAAAAGLNTGPIDPNLIRDDKNGLITLLLYNEPTDSAASYAIANKENGTGLPTLTFPNARCATNPVPAKGTSVLPSLNTLSWTNTDPNHVSGTITCNVYFGTSEPNLALPGYGLTQIAAGTTATSATIPAGMRPLAETTYYWIVDSYDSSTVPAFLGTGADWSFSVTGVPLIVTHPAAQTVTPGQTAQFSVTVDSYSTPHYTWYHSADNANNTTPDAQVGTDSATLSFTAAGADEGYYYCKVVNNSGEANAAYSNTASLIVQRQVAHWTLDQADFVGGQYRDVSGNGHHATPITAVPTFTAGVITGSDAVSMDPNSFANAGTWNPAYVSGQLTIAAWINWRGANAGYQDVLSKMDTYLENDMMWQFGVSQGGNVSLLADHGNNDNAILNGQPAIGTWEFVAMTFNGTTATLYRALNGNISFTTVSGTYSFGTDLQAAIGLGARADGTGIFNGTIDDVQVFNYAKDAYGIADLYNQMVSRDFCLRAYGSSQYDLDTDNNCRIDMPDFAAMAVIWLECGLYPNCP
jgi:hypothetical protein